MPKDLFLGAFERRKPDPEAKRKLSVSAFIEIFDEDAIKLNNIEFLATGYDLS